MTVPPSKEKAVSAVEHSDSNSFVQGQWVESGLEIKGNGSGIEVSDGRVYLTNGAAWSVGDSRLSVDNPGNTNHFYLIDRGSLVIGYNETGSDPSDPYIKIAEGTPNSGSLTDLNKGSPPVHAKKGYFGDSTEIRETSAGSTVLVNNNGNPINIQLYPSGRAFLRGNDTATTISNQNEWVEITGDWDSAHMNYLSTDGNGRLTYNGDVTTQTQYNVSGSYSTTDNNAQYEIGMFKDGSLKERTNIDFSAPRQDEVISLPGIFGFTDETEEGMTHSVRVRNTTNTSDVTIHALSFTLRG